MNTPSLTLFFDGKCPFCAAEMTRLRAWDKHGRLGFVDMAQYDFDPSMLGVEMAALDRELHSRTAAGKILVGIDSILAAYTLVGKGWIVLPLRVALLRPMLAWLYRGFARNRYRFSRWLGYKAVPPCQDGSCQMRHPFAGR